MHVNHNWATPFDKVIHFQCRLLLSWVLHMPVTSCHCHRLSCYSHILSAIPSYAIYHCHHQHYHGTIPVLQLTIPPCTWPVSPPAMCDLHHAVHFCTVNHAYTTYCFGPFSVYNFTVCVGSQDVLCCASLAWSTWLCTSQAIFYRAIYMYIAHWKQSVGSLPLAQNA